MSGIQVRQFLLGSLLRRTQRPVLGALAVVLLSTAARAQYAIDPRVNTQPRMGQTLPVGTPIYGNVNVGPIRPSSPLIGGNPYATGNVTHGLSLRSFSPISDPLAFRGSLGSAALSSFRRDSVSVYDAAAPLGSTRLARPYYDPATTTYTGGFLQNLSVPSAVLPGRPNVNALDARAGLYQSPAQLFGRSVSPAQTGADRISALPPTSIFGPIAPPPPLPYVTEDVRSRSAQAAWDNPWATGSELTRLAQGATGAEVPDTPGALQRPEGIGAAPGPGGVAVRPNALEFLLRGEGGRADLTEEAPAWAGGWRGGDFRPGILPPTAAPTEATPGPADIAVRPRVTDPSVLPGFDVFNDMRLALALEKSPGAAWFEEMADEALKTQKLLDPGQAEETAVDPREHIQELLREPVRSFAGGGESPANTLMLQAEAELTAGRYMEAARRFDAARAVSPGNPLPLLGAGHALLGAGSYSAAADALVRGLGMFPDVARFRFDLNALMGGGEQIDIRRADLMRRLERTETPELRFLLGYLEYHTGDRERGLANLEKAAAADRRGTIIGRYPALLRGEGGQR